MFSFCIFLWTLITSPDAFLNNGDVHHKISKYIELIVEHQKTELLPMSKKSATVLSKLANWSQHNIDDRLWYRPLRLVLSSRIFQQQKITSLYTLNMLILLFIIVLIWRIIVQKTSYERERITQDQQLQLMLAEAQLKGEEKERARTAKELHDGVASVLSAAKLHINTINNYQGQKSPFQDIGQLIDIAVSEIRNISHNLTPETILTEGLAYAIQSFCQRINKPNFQIHCYIIGSLNNVNRNYQVYIYRIIQESVANILKHANASETIVQLTEEKDRILITIEDNGIGFDIGPISGKGIGLKNLYTRVHSIQGYLDIRSNHGQGTSICIEIPTPASSLTTV